MKTSLESCRKRSIENQVVEKGNDVKVDQKKEFGPIKKVLKQKVMGKEKWYLVKWKNSRD